METAKITTSYKGATDVCPDVCPTVYLVLDQSTLLFTLAAAKASYFKVY